jgi:hypothetical protein
MTPSIEQLEQLTQRIEQLERHNRWLKRLGLAAVAVLGLAVLSGQATPTAAEPRIVVAEGFQLVDAEGKPRGELMMTAEGPQLRLLDAEAKPQVALSATAGRSALDLIEKEKRRASIEVAAGDASAAVFSEQGSARAMMSAGKDSAGKETAACALHDPLGNRQFAVTTRSEGTLLSLYDKNAVSRLAVTVNEVGSGYFIKDDKGKLRMQLQMSSGKPQFGLFDENGNELFSKP